MIRFMIAGIAVGAGVITMSSTLDEMGFSVLVKTTDGGEFGYGSPEDMGFGGDEVMQLTFEGGKKHHFDVEEIESVVLITDE